MTTTMITEDELSGCIGNIKSYYSTLIRNDYYLPPLNSSCINFDYLMKVHQNEVYCPKYKDVRMRPCESKPLKIKVYKSINRNLKGSGIGLGIKEK